MWQVWNCSVVFLLIKDLNFCLRTFWCQCLDEFCFLTPTPTYIYYTLYIEWGLCAGMNHVGSWVTSVWQREWGLCARMHHVGFRVCFAWEREWALCARVLFLVGESEIGACVWWCNKVWLENRRVELVCGDAIKWSFVLFKQNEYTNECFNDDLQHTSTTSSASFTSTLCATHIDNVCDMRNWSKEI